MNDNRTGNHLENQSGLAALAVVAFLSIVIVLGVAGLAVDRAHRKPTMSRATPTASTKTASSALARRTPLSDRQATPTSANWLLYTSPGDDYTMRVPDGWKLVQSGTDAAASLNSSSDSLEIKQGIKATVAVQTARGNDAQPTLNLRWYTLSDAQLEGVLSTANDGQPQTSLKTTSGLTIEKYYKYEAQPPANVLQPPQGTTYTYIIRGSGSLLWTQYFCPVGSSDYHQNVEQALQTVQLRN